MLRLQLLALVGASAACFTPPNPPVLFACEPDGASDCPPGYRCEGDGCCHREGSDYEQHQGDCRLGLGDGPAATTALPSTGSESSATGSDQTGDAGATSSTTGSTSTTTGANATGETSTFDDANSTAAQ